MMKRERGKRKRCFNRLRYWCDSWYTCVEVNEHRIADNIPFYKLLTLLTSSPVLDTIQNKVIPYVDQNFYWIFWTLLVWIRKQPIKISLKVPKVFRQQKRKKGYKYLGTSVIISLMCWKRIKKSNQQFSRSLASDKQNLTTLYDKMIKIYFCRFCFCLNNSV